MRDGSADADNTDLLHSTVPRLDLSKLKIISALGRGAKGVVFLAQDLISGDTFALKAISRSLLHTRSKTLNSDGGGGGYRRIEFEQRVLSCCRHPLLPTLRGVFDSENIFGYAIDYCPGPDLHSLRKKQAEKMFSDDTIRFYAAELVLAMDYLHGMGIVYRDLKPENVMIQENGHLMLVDFDLSTKLLPFPVAPKTSARVGNAVTSPPHFAKKKRLPFYKCCYSGISPHDDSEESATQTESSDPVRCDSNSAGKANSFVGTEEYVAPEIVSGKGHDFAADWWSLGVVLYEMLYGTTPFRGSDRKETFYRILVKEPDLSGGTTPLRGLIRELLVKDPNERIRVDGIKGHDFFKGMDWDSVIQIQRPPLVPEGAEMKEVEEIDDVEAFVERVFKEKIDDAKNKKATSPPPPSNDGNKKKRSFSKGLRSSSSNPSNDFLIF